MIMRTFDPLDAMARTLVVQTLPALEAALIRGVPFRAAVAAMLATVRAIWEADHGPDVARRAAEILEALGPATVLTPYGRNRFIAAGPLAAIPKHHPLRANDNAPPPRAKGGWWRYCWPWRWRPLSRA
jgi:hypothetical protein